MGWIPLHSVVQPVSVEDISATSALLFRKATETRQREAELLVLLDRLALLVVHKACWAEVERFFHNESAGGDDTAINDECAANSARGTHESNLSLNNLAAEAKRLIL